MSLPNPAGRDARITQGLMDWFAAVQRDLPWRRTGDPYAIWISEIMLQQTQVATVIPYYERFMGRFPDVAALASAPTEQVLKAWEGLGYYSRARHLQAAAQLVLAHHGGVMPETWDEVRRLPGVGDYTAGAILSIAHGVRVPAVDGNVLRVIARLDGLHEDVARPATKKLITARAAALLPESRPGDFNQSLMELGATVCTPGKPRCEACPVREACVAHAAGEQSLLPIKAKKQAARQATLAAALVAREGRFLLVRRPAEGLWGGMWSFPTAEVADGEPAEAPRAIAEALGALGLQVAMGPLMQTQKHTLTHRQLTIPVYEARHAGGELAPGAGVWAAPEEFGRYALPVPFQKIAKALDPGPLFRLL
jgi:A/G-specific adenine glycosylase